MIDVARDLERMRDYVVGRMSDDERRSFEERLVRDPDLVHELELSLRMREGFAQLTAHGYVVRGAARARASRAWLPALAAAAIAGIAVILWVGGGPSPSPVLGATLSAVATGGAAHTVTQPFTFVATRGAQAQDLHLPSQGAIEFRAAPGVRASGVRYRATLARESASGALEPVGAVGGLALGQDGYVHSYAAAARLSQGRYQLRIQTEPGQPGAGESFSFNLRADAPGTSR